MNEFGIKGYAVPKSANKEALNTRGNKINPDTQKNS